MPAYKLKSEFELEKPLPGFWHIKRYWDQVNNITTAKVFPGEFYVTKQDEMICTVLGSCISACIFDKHVGVGGMNHFMLPASSDSSGGLLNNVANDELRYGCYAMERLINELLKYGAAKENLEVKIFGGARIYSETSEVGRKNIHFIYDFLRVEGLKVASEDLGGTYPRKVNFYPASGLVRVKKIRDLHNDTITRREVDYRQRIISEKAGHDVEMFNE